MTRAVLFLALLLAACSSGGGSGGSSRPGLVPVATAHGTVLTTPDADVAALREAIEAGFTRARTRTRQPERVDALSVDGLQIQVNYRMPVPGRYQGQQLIEIAPQIERVLDHEMQHWIADALGIGGACLQWQDHGERDDGGCNLDEEWAR